MNDKKEGGGYEVERMESGDRGGDVFSDFLAFNDSALCDPCRHTPED
jgi:hypothetical protein